MSRLGISFAAVMFTAFAANLPVAAADPPAEPLRSRHEFATAMNKVKVGMSEAEVVALLGRPDDMRTERDPGGVEPRTDPIAFFNCKTKEVWRYGASGHLTTALLGQVYIDKDGVVEHVFGKNTPPPKRMFAERELRSLLDALGHVPSYNSGWEYNPRNVIKAVNLLQPLGKVKALAAIDEFLRVTSHLHDERREGMFLVLRTLFEVPDSRSTLFSAPKNRGYMQPMQVGGSRPKAPDDPKLLPRFPISIEGDIPFLLVRDFSSSLDPEQPESHVAYFRKNGQIRAEPLAPSNRPFRALESFAKSPRWIYSEPDGFDGDDDGQLFLGVQLLKLLESVYRFDPDYDKGLSDAEADRAVGTIFAKAADLEIHWDSSAHKYTFVDGTSLPEPEHKHYFREIWRPMVVGLDVELILERVGPGDVSARVKGTHSAGEPAPIAVLQVFEPDAEDVVLVRFSVGGSTRATATRNRFRLKEGRQVQVRLAVGKESQLSPIFKP